MPYSHSDPRVREARYKTATSVAAFLMNEGATVFSPITYGHQICQYGIDTNFKRWAELDYPMIAWADELWLLELDGQDTSFGVREKLNYVCGLDIFNLSYIVINNNSISTTKKTELISWLFWNCSIFKIKNFFKRHRFCLGFPQNNQRLQI